MDMISPINTDQPFLDKLFFVLFLRKIALGEFEAAQEYFIKALRLFRSSAKQFDELPNLIIHWAVRQPYVSPVILAQRVFDSLPDNLARSNRLRQQVFGKLHIAQAFDEYSKGHGTKTRNHILKGMCFDSSFLKNRGVVAIFAKSFLTNPTSSLKSIPDYNRSAESIPQSVIGQIENVLGSTVDNFERVTRGESNSKVYLINAGGQRYILRLVEKDALEQRLAVVERVRATGVPTPPIIAHDSSLTIDNGPAWLLEEWSSGAGLKPPKISFINQLAIVAELGLYLRWLHTIRTKGVGKILSARLDAPYPTFAAWLDSQQQTIEDGCLIGAVPETALFALDASARFLRESYIEPSVLCHGDLCDDNILVEGEHVIAVIDWGDVQGCDPAYDIAVFLIRMGAYWYPTQDSEILTAILKAYNPERPSDFYRRVIAHRLLLAATEVTRLMREEDGDEYYLNACRAILANAGLDKDHLAGSFRAHSDGL